MYEFDLVRGLAGAVLTLLALLGLHLLYERARAWAIDRGREAEFIVAMFGLALVGLVALFGIS